jgi:hypothetical protein
VDIHPSTHGVHIIVLAYDISVATVSAWIRRSRVMGGMVYIRTAHLTQPRLSGRQGRSQAGAGGGGGLWSPHRSGHGVRKARHRRRVNDLKEVEWRRLHGWTRKSDEPEDQVTGQGSEEEGLRHGRGGPRSEHSDTMDLGVNSAEDRDAERDVDLPVNLFGGGPRLTKIGGASTRME